MHKHSTPNQADVSIIIPVYNEANYIATCIEAILEQNILPKEIIIVDNNSSDETVEIVSKYELVRVVKETRQGVVFSRNAGFDAAKSPILVKIDADTVVYDGWLSAYSNLFVDDPSLHAASGYLSNDEPVSPWMGRVIKWASNFLIFGFNGRLAPYDMIYGSNMWIRKSVWNEIKSELRMNNSIWEDLDLSIVLAKSNFKNVAIIRHPLYSISSRRSKDGPVKVIYYLLGSTRAMLPSYPFRAALNSVFMIMSGVFIWAASRSVRANQGFDENYGDSV